MFCVFRKFFIALSLPVTYLELKIELALLVPPVVEELAAELAPPAADEGTSDMMQAESTPETPLVVDEALLVAWDCLFPITEVEVLAEEAALRFEVTELAAEDWPAAVEDCRALAACELVMLEAFCE